MITFIESGPSAALTAPALFLNSGQLPKMRASDEDRLVKGTSLLEKSVKLDVLEREPHVLSDLPSAA